ncbi:RDD family protein [Streptomyces sp. NPDC005322]|uniref:RDD family protein n=1 Tax=Streptomyces sp. NPDC005322 TaxID=3157032 RepID=UPI0033A361D9
MSASTSGSADGSSIPGFYPDPSIPGYIRYWNGAAWVPGTSRPAPAEGESMPAPPPGVTHTQVIGPVPDETGPMFLDEDPAPPAGEETGAALPELRQRGEMDVRDTDGVGPVPVPPGGVSASVDWNDPRRLHGARPEAGLAWQADASHQAGFGGEQDRRVSWGSEGVPDPRRAMGGPGEQGPDQGGPGEARGQEGSGDQGTLSMGGGGTGDGTDRSAQALPPARRTPELPSAQGGKPAAPPADGTLSIRAAGRGGGGDPETDQGPASGRDEGTMTIRAVGHGGPRRGAGTAPASPPQGPQQAQQPQRREERRPQQAQQPQRREERRPQQAQQPYQPQRLAPQAPQQPGGIPAQGGAPAWQQQPHHPAQQPPQPTAPQGGVPESVIPWKPPVDNPFLQAAQAQGRPATLGRRFCARLIDMGVLLALVGGVAFPLWGEASDHISQKVETAKQTGETVTVYFLDGTTGGYLGIVLGLLLVLGIVLEALPTAKWGLTLGKRVCGVRVLDIEGHDTPSFGAALRRWLVYGVLGLLVIGVLNVLWCLFDRPWRQCWHDKAARTFVASAG